LDRRDGPRIFYRLPEARSGETRHLFEFLRYACREEEILQEDTRKLKQAIQSGSCTRTAWRPYSALAGARNDVRV
jgi:hypothetical protein